MKTEKKTGADRTQRAIRDEWWSDERIQSFFELESTSNEASDFHILNKAYQGMTGEAFERFIGFFCEAGRNLDQVNIDGDTMLNIVSQHRNSAEYADILKKAGAK